MSYLKATVRLAAYIHDWGKANNPFQGVVRAKIKDAHPKRFLPNEPQLIRHEVVSVLLAWEFREWLEQGEGDFLIALAAAGGHHLKIGGKGGKKTDELGEIRQSGDILSLYVLDVIEGKQKFNRHFRQLLKYGIKALGLPKNIKLSHKPSLFWSSTQIKEKRFQIVDEAVIKLESFKAWGKESIVCTVDTVLGWLQCNRRPIYCFPAIANAAFVFDEVHCYDDALFGALLRFLEVVKAPVLLMSASFLPWQKDVIEKAVGEIKIEPIPGDPDIEAQPRYQFHYQEQTD